MQKPKRHNLKPSVLDNDDKEWTLEQLLEKLNDSFFNTPLPCREEEIQIINKFIQQTYNPKYPVLDPHRRGRKPKGSEEIPPPSLLYITGNPGTGKTECVRYCCQHSVAPSTIKYINCKTQRVDLYRETDVVPRILVP